MRITQGDSGCKKVIHQGHLLSPYRESGGEGGHVYSGAQHRHQGPSFPHPPSECSISLQCCASWSQNGCQSTRHDRVEARSERAGHKGTFSSCACLSSGRQHFPRSPQRTSPDVMWSSLDQLQANGDENVMIRREPSSLALWGDAF